MRALKDRIEIFILTAALAVLFFTGIPVSAEEAQGTDGTEMQVMEPETLEIQIGKEWAGKEFLLKTDTYVYPGTIMVGEDGVLRTELGGSKNYILSMADPDSEKDQTLATGEPDGTETSDNVKEDDSVSPAGEKEQDQVQKDTFPKEDPDAIPRKHMILFVTGMAAAVGGLIALHIVQKRREEGYEEDMYEEADGEDEK